MHEQDPLGELAFATGLPLERYRADHVQRVVERAMQREGIETRHALALRVRADAAVRERLRRAIAVSVTSRFRDPQQFALLEEKILPELAARFDRLRIWSAGCSDGSELLSIGTVLHRLGVLERSFLVGSDVLAENVAAARRTLGELPGARVRLEQRDLIDGSPPPGRFALVVCRNVAIYLTADAKEVLHRALASGLSRGGILLLGKSERLPRPAEIGLAPAFAHAYRATGRRFTAAR